MAKHQHDPNAAALWIYFQAIISWVKAVFPRYRRDMRGRAHGRRELPNALPHVQSPLVRQVNEKAWILI